MDSEPYQKVGRGGAGNYYTQKDINDAARRAATDLESQAPTTTPSTSPTQNSSYIPSGRGGAGNFTSASAAANAKVAEPLSTATSTTGRKEAQFGRTYGRGGAGNYGGGEEERRMEEEERREEERRGYERVVRDVEMGLQEPEKAHLGGREGDGGDVGRV